MNSDKDKWRPFLLIAKKLGCNSEAVLSFLQFIDAPSEMPCFKQVIINSRRLLEHWENFLLSSQNRFPVVNSEQIAAWKWMLQILDESDDSEFEELSGYLKKVLPGKRPPLTNYLTSHPAYSLFCLYLYGVHREKYEICQALSLLAAATLRDSEEQTGQDYHSIRYQFLLNVRKLAETESGLRVLPQFPQEATSLGAYVASITELDQGDKLIHAIRFRLEKINLGLLPLKKSHGGRTNGIRSVSEGLERDLGDSNDPTSSAYRITGVLSGSSEELSAYQKEYGNEEDQLAEHSLVTRLIDGAVEIDDGSTNFQRSFDAHGYRNRIAMHNQLLPSQKLGLSPWETATLISRLVDQSIDADVRLALSLMLWCSVELSDLPKIQYYTDKRYKELKESGKTPKAGLLRRGQDLVWILHPAIAKIKGRKYSNLRADAQNHIWIPIPGLLNSLYRDFRTQYKTKRDSLFGMRKKEIIEKVELVLEDLRSAEGGEHTSARISRHLFHLGFNLPNTDITLPMFWSGKEHYLGRVVNHYTRIDVDMVRVHYRQSCMVMADEVKGDLEYLKWGRPIRDIRISRQMEESPHGVGSMFCPPINSVEKIFSALAAELNKKRPSRRLEIFPGKISEIHNLMTLYTVLSIALASGARALNKALKMPGHIDVQSGCALICDKDTGDRYNSRLIWLPDKIIEQYQNYLEHLDHIYRWLFIVDSEKAKALVGAINNKKPGPEVADHWLFFIAEDHSVLRATTERIAEKLNRYGYDFKGNALRHLFRSMAVSKKIAPEIVNAQLGHWENGQEPWGAWSCLRAISLKNSLEGFFEELLKKCHFNPIKGVGSIREHGYSDLGTMEAGEIREQISLF
jgi:hypothetical protein